MSERSDVDELYGQESAFQRRVEKLLEIIVKGIVELIKLMTLMILAAIAAVLWAAPYALRGLCVFFAYYTGSLLFERAWTLFGGDLPALIPAGLLAGLPIVIALDAGSPDEAFGRLVAAGVVLLAMSRGITVLTPFFTGIVVVSLLTALVATLLLRRSKDEEQVDGKRVVVSDDGSAPDLHRVSELGHSEPVSAR